jgi:energy-coupling factor transport system permease protein
MTVTASRVAPKGTASATDRLPGDARRLPRGLHPVAWWLWAIAMATAAARTNNPLVLLLILAVCGFVVSARRTDAPWARAFGFYLMVGCSVIAIRVLFRILLGGGVAASGPVLFTLPTLPSPSWATGVRLGGPVSASGALAALYDGMRLATLLCCIGAANALANPKRALRVLPGALYELGVAVVVSITVAPQLVESAGRVRRARRLRGAGGKRLAAFHSLAMPVLHDALERSLALAAAMDARGYGRRAGTSAAARRTTAVLLIGGLAGLCVGVYGLMDATTPAVLRIPALLTGAAACCLGLALGSRRVQHSSYRPDPWRLAEWLVVGLGLVPATVFTVLATADASALAAPLDPLGWPSLPALPAVAVLVAGLAGFAAPPPLLSGTAPQ